MYIITSKGKRIEISLEKLWSLPVDTLKLNCSNYCLTSLPELPPNLQELRCSGNYLTSLPELPPSLQELYCSNNRLTSLPSLPPNLDTLFCPINRLTSLPELPPSLHALCCHDNPFEKIYPDLKMETVNLWNRSALFIQTKWRIRDRMKACPYHRLGRKHMENEWGKFKDLWGKS